MPSLSDRSRIFLRLARRQVRRWQALLRWRRTSLAGIPILFANSFPKSGTHLLTQILQGFPGVGPAVDSGLPAVVTFDGYSGRQRSSQAILSDLQRLLPGDIAYGHLHALPPAVDFLRRDGIAAWFILRDPRDVVISHVHYITEMEPDHIHHAYYTQTLTSFDQRLRTSILGMPGEDIPFPDIAGRFAPYLGWLEQPQVLSLRFEQLIIDRDRALGSVLDHAVQHGFPLCIDRPEALRRLAGAIDPQRSPTFRSGKVGGWKEKFSPENTALFKEIAGDLLVRLGYESDLNW
jgi:hypothetical protein